MIAMHRPPPPILQHERWPLIRSLIRHSQYDRDDGRHRFDIDVPREHKSLLLNIRVECVTCGRLMNPIRQRNSSSPHAYIAVACPLTVSPRCSKGRAASDAYEAIARVAPPPSRPTTQRDLFE